MTTIYGDIFNFTEVGYVPPTWSGSIYLFGELYGSTRALWTDLDSIYLATDTRLNILDISTELLYAYMTAPLGGFTAVWANDTEVYLGTISGTKYISKTCISGTTDNHVNITTCLMDYNSSAPVRYIHGNNNLISIITDTNISITKLGAQGYTSTALGTNFLKCFVTPNKLYYTTSGIINRLDSLVCDWTEPSYKYITGSGILAPSLAINDIFVTHNTSSESGYNTLFVATSSGVYLIDEGTGYYSIFYRST